MAKPNLGELLTKLGVNSETSRKRVGIVARLTLALALVLAGVRSSNADTVDNPGKQVNTIDAFPDQYAAVDKPQNPNALIKTPSDTGTPQADEKEYAIEITNRIWSLLKKIKNDQSSGESGHPEKGFTIESLMAWLPDKYYTPDILHAIYLITDIDILPHVQTRPDTVETSGAAAVLEEWSQMPLE